MRTPCRCVEEAQDCSSTCFWSVRVFASLTSIWSNFDEAKSSQSELGRLSVLLCAAELALKHADPNAFYAGCALMAIPEPSSRH